MLVLPRGAPSQLRMAKSCVDAGVGRAPSGENISVERIEADVRTLLEVASYRTNAVRLREAILDVPPAADVVTRLEHLV